MGVLITFVFNMKAHLAQKNGLYKDVCDKLFAFCAIHNSYILEDEKDKRKYCFSDRKQCQVIYFCWNSIYIIIFIYF